MTCIIEDELNQILKFANSRPSKDALTEYWQWKTKTRSEMASQIENMNESDARFVAFVFYASTIEFADSREIVKLLDKEILRIQLLHSATMKSIIDKADKTIQNELIADLICGAYDSNILYESKKYENDSLVRVVAGSRWPILNDIQSLLLQKSIKDRILSQIPR